jgi:hypothetical protein
VLTHKQNHKPAGKRKELQLAVPEAAATAPPPPICIVELNW